MQEDEALQTLCPQEQRDLCTHQCRGKLSFSLCKSILPGNRKEIDLNQLLTASRAVQRLWSYSSAAGHTEGLSQDRQTELGREQERGQWGGCAGSRDPRSVFGV